MAGKARRCRNTGGISNSGKRSHGAGKGVLGDGRGNQTGPSLLGRLGHRCGLYHECRSHWAKRIELSDLGNCLADLPSLPFGVPFFQTPPTLDNQYEDDPLLQEYVARKIPKDFHGEAVTTYRELGEMAGGELYRASLAERHIEPTLTRWDPWGHRIDRIDVSPLWKRGDEIAPKYGLVATGYEKPCGSMSRVHQFAMNYLVQASLDFHSCPLAMSDGAAKTLLASGNQGAYRPRGFSLDFTRSGSLLDLGAMDDRENRRFGCRR